MSPVRYWVLVADELLDGSGVPWAGAGLSLIETGMTPYPGMRWCRFADDNAPPDLEGKKIELTIARVDGRPIVTDRRVITSQTCMPAVEGRRVIHA